VEALNKSASYRYAEAVEAYCNDSVTVAVEVSIWLTRPDIDTAGIAEDCKGWLFRTSPGHNATELTAHSR
jgi:hypothetical protein